MRFCTIVILCILGSCSGGCSFYVAHQTREISKTMYEHASRKTIEAMTGPPVSEQKFSPPFPSTQARDRSVRFASCKASYIYHGRADDLEAFDGLCMYVALTWGIGEFKAFPQAIELSRQLEESVHHYEVWYDVSGRCVAYKIDRDIDRGR